MERNRHRYCYHNTKRELRDDTGVEPLGDEDNSDNANAKFSIWKKVIYEKGVILDTDIFPNILREGSNCEREVDNCRLRRRKPMEDSGERIAESTESRGAITASRIQTGFGIHKKTSGRNVHIKDSKRQKINKKQHQNHSKRLPTSEITEWLRVKSEQSLMLPKIVYQIDN